MAHAFPWDGKSFSLEFNAPEGRDFDRTCFVTVPLDQIANVFRIPLDNGSRPHRPDEEKQRWERLLAGRPEALASWSSLRVGSYPNPWATLIYEHNIKIAKALGYEIGAIFERAFS